MNRVLFLLIACMGCGELYAQTDVSGRVKSSAGADGVPYVNIGIKGKDIGTVAAKDGTFHIQVPQQYGHDTLTFSSIGYEELKVAVADAGAAKTFILLPLVAQLKEATVATKKLTEKYYGLKRYKPLLHFTDGSVTQHDIFEIAQLLPLGDQPAKITAVSLYIGAARADSATFRINFYKYDGRRPGERIVQKSIVQTKAVKEGWLKFDLGSEAIYLKGDVIAAVEFIPDPEKPGPVVYEIKPGGRIKSFVRKSSLGIWQVPPHQYRMYVTALGSDMKEEAEEKEIKPSFAVYSKEVGDSFYIFTHLPPRYGKNKNRKYPVVYVTDANLYFSYLSDTLDKEGDEQPIVIGIGYKDFVKMDSLRNRDYTYPVAPVADSFTTSGGADKFYSFISNELLPQIGDMYRTDRTNRCIMGHSLGGYFVLYALYKDLQRGQPVFTKYVAASPSLHYDGEYLLHRFSALHPATGMRQKVCISWGALEEGEEDHIKYGDVVKRFIQQLSAPQFSNILLTQKVYPGAAHMETAVPSFYDGLGE